jgi:hypothetical protein
VPDDKILLLDDNAGFGELGEDVDEDVDVDVWDFGLVELAFPSKPCWSFLSWQYFIAASLTVFYLG